MADSVPAHLLLLCGENQGPMLLAVSYSLLAIAIITVLLRLQCRVGLRNGISSDDYTIVASLVSLHVNFQLAIALIDRLTDIRNHWRGKLD